MATYTPNLNLKKPSTGEYYDVVADDNDSKDKIDLAVGALMVLGVNVLKPPQGLTPMKGDGITDDTIAFDALNYYAQQNGKVLIIPQTISYYRMTKFQSLSGVKYIGIGKPEIGLYFNGGSPVMAGYENDTLYSDIYFHSLEEDMEWSRGDITNKFNIEFTRCKIEGFRDLGTVNAWGLYLDKSKNIRIKDCEFENNSQADIAIVEGCENIEIINARGTTLHINLEPNDGYNPIKNVKISGTSMKQLSVSENDLLHVSIQNLLVENCSIETLLYDGATVNFINTRIENVYGEWGGEVDFGGALQFGGNILTDPNLSNLDTVNGAFKIIYTSSNNAVTREYALGHSVLSINPLKENTVVYMESMHTILVEQSKQYALAMISQMEYPVDSAWIGQGVKIGCYDNTGARFEIINLGFNRGLQGEKTNFSQKMAILKLPAGTVGIKIILSNSDATNLSTGKHIIRKIGLFEVISNSLLSATQLPLFTGEDKTYSLEPMVSPPVSAVTGALKGTIHHNYNPQPGSYLGWICTETSKAGTWKGFGLIQA